MQNKEIEEEYHLLPQIDAKKKDPVSRDYTKAMGGTYNFRSAITIHNNVLIM